MAGTAVAAHSAAAAACGYSRKFAGMQWPRRLQGLQAAARLDDGYYCGPVPHCFLAATATYV
jgi:hypothetical protein